MYDWMESIGNREFDLETSVIEILDLIMVLYLVAWPNTNPTCRVRAIAHSLIPVCHRILAVIPLESNSFCTCIVHPLRAQKSFRRNV